MMRNIYFYGDSNTYGFDPADFFRPRYNAEKIWTNIVQAELADSWTVTANGMNGREIPSRDSEFRSLYSNIERNYDGGACAIDVFAVMLGSNDYLGMRIPDAAAVALKMERALVRIREHLDREGADEAEILLIAPPAMYIAAGEGLAFIDTTDGSLSAAYKSAAARLGCRFVDTLPWDVPLAFDGVHFSEEGHAVFAERMVRCLKDF